MSAQLAERQGVRGAEFVDVRSSLQLHDSSHLRERDNMLLGANLCGGVLNGRRSRGEVSGRLVPWRVPRNSSCGSGQGAGCHDA